MNSVTATDLEKKCPMVYVECLGKRQLARTVHRDGKALIIIEDNATLSRLEGDGTFVVPWQEIADAMNAGRPVFIQCQDKVD